MTVSPTESFGFHSRKDVVVGQHLDFIWYQCPKASCAIGRQKSLVFMSFIRLLRSGKPPSPRYFSESQRDVNVEDIHPKSNIHLLEILQENISIGEDVQLD